MTEDKFRDTLSTVDSQGERVWIHPKKPKGRYHTYRLIVTLFLLAIMVITPFIKMNGEPFVLLNIIERKFILFGQTFWPQDFYLFGLVFILSLVILVVFTVIYGRIFCGWICPQTIFMEMVFRKIEYFFEGDYNKQQKLDRQDWNTEKVIRRGGKHVVFIIISFLISNLFLTYIIGVDELYKIITEPIKDHVVGFMSIIGFSGAFYWVFAWFREQVCIIACPYGRLQGVMLDNNSLVVAYDYERGEPRGKLRKNEERTEGDCIDCKQCVHVCPTGIDIRNGTQLECINCTACIDECDTIMDMIEKPRGLIGFNSEDGIKTGAKFKFNTRLIMYTIFMFVLTGIVVLLFSLRSDIDITIIKQRGHLYEELDSGKIRNFYNLTLINKTNSPTTISLATDTSSYDLAVIGTDIELDKGEVKNVLIVLDRKIKGALKMKQKVPLRFYSNGEKIASKEINFLTPIGK